jgi:hypothetical protein
MDKDFILIVMAHSVEVHGIWDKKFVNKWIYNYLKKQLKIKWICKSKFNNENH